MDFGFPRFLIVAAIVLAPVVFIVWTARTFASRNRRGE